MQDVSSRRRAAGRHEPRETRIITLTARMYAIVRNVAVAAGESEFGENLAQEMARHENRGLPPAHSVEKVVPRSCVERNFFRLMEMFTRR